MDPPKDCHGGGGWRIDVLLIFFTFTIPNDLELVHGNL